jgi:hypothetical protein
MIENYDGFRDISEYKGEIVYLMKRAQILASDLFGSNGWEFEDMEELTMFPDYQVPQVLNSKGVLVYSDELQSMIDSSQEILRNSEMEIEIRAATVVACDMIAQLINAPAYKADWLIWQRGENEKKLGLLKNHHKTRTTFY